MANCGKFTDRNPNLRAAGIASQDATPLNEWIKEYHPEELLKHHNFRKCKQIQQNVERLKRDISICDSDTHDLLSTELNKTRFIEFREQFFEGLYSKKAKLGVAAKIKSKPKWVTNESMTFGIPSTSTDPVYDIILPPKSAAEVNKDYCAWHDKYIISHNHYFPSEAVKRNYNTNFDPSKCFGEYTGADKSGSKTKRCLTHCVQNISINTMQYAFMKRTKPVLGENHFKYKYKVPLYQCYGIKSFMDKCNVRCLLENIEPGQNEDDIISGLIYANFIRYYIKKKENFILEDFNLNLTDFDENHTGYLPLSTIYKALASQYVSLNDAKCRLALKAYKLLAVDDESPDPVINWKKFAQFINIKWIMPRSLHELSQPENHIINNTTYQSFCNDSKRIIKPKHRDAIADCLNVKENEDVETAGDCISPSIPTQYFLSPSDFSLPRSKEDLRAIFKGLVTEGFDELWETSKKYFNPDNDDDEFLSVDQLRAVLRQSNKPTNKI